MPNVEAGLRISKLTLVINSFLAAGKIVTGILGHSYVLIADGIESIADIFSSFVVWGGLQVAVIPADENHPYGHGKAEPVAGIIVSMILLVAAMLIAVESVHHILTPHLAPAWYTLPVLVAVVVIKESMYRLALRAGLTLQSTALKSDAWHHRSDALTSAAACAGISIALIGGRGYETADDWAALMACGVISWNGFRLLRNAVDEVMDVSVSREIIADVRAIAGAVPGVVAIEKCRIRKAGLHLALDIHVVVDGNISVRQGHDIAHRVTDQLRASPHRINDVTVHIEPARPPETPPT